MNDVNKIMEFIKSYSFPYNEEERKKMSVIFGKIINILCGKEQIITLSSDDIIYLGDKNIMEFTSRNSFIIYLNCIKNGYGLNEHIIKDIYIMLNDVAIKLKELEDNWKNYDICNNMLQNNTLICDMNENEINSLVNMIINSNKTDLEKEKLLITISLNIHSNRK